MKMKKPMVVKAPSSAPAATGGGATIADRFKLEPVAAPAATGGTVNKTASLIALIAALAGLAVSGLLAFTLYKHWEFLMPA